MISYIWCFFCFLSPSDSFAEFSVVSFFVVLIAELGKWSKKDFSVEDRHAILVAKMIE